mgnify:CR=1 FL=1
MKKLSILLIGMFFGVVLVKSEVISWFRIQKMFRFEEAHMYLIITAAIVVGAISVALLKRFRPHTIDGEEIQFSKNNLDKGTVIGGVMFGLGWAITGACPGPIYAQIGSGEYLALITFAGAFIGAYFYAVFHSLVLVRRKEKVA